MNKKKLLAAIEAVSPGISSNSIIEQSNLVIFDKNRLISYNDEIAVSVPFESDLSGGIPSTELSKLLRRMSGKEIEISQKDNQTMLACGRTKAGFNIQESEVPKIIIEENNQKWKSLPEDFSTALFFCLFSAATDINKGILTCLKMEKDLMISCDNFRLTRYQMAAKITKILLIPGSIVKSLIDHNPIKYVQTDNWIHFQNKEKVIFSCRTMEGEFPDVERLLDIEGEKIAFPKELKQTLQRTEILAEISTEDSKIKAIVITLEKGKITCRAENIVGWITETIRTKYQGKEIIFSIDPQLLLQILDRVNEAIIDDFKICFEGKNFVHVIALIRHSDEK